MGPPREERRQDGRKDRESEDRPGSPTTGTAAQRWARERTFHHTQYPAERVARERTESVTVCVPAKQCAGTVGAVVSELAALRRAGAIDEVVVVDAASPDGTAEVARRAGARVLQEAELAGEWGPVHGKGDAMWRALPALEGEVVCFLDADTEGFQSHFATGLVGPLVCEEGVEFVKAFYRRPLAQGGATVPEGGGRVNHLTARPALAVFYPELAEVRQPLAGETAARRELLERVPFATGYGVEVAMVIDVWREVGLAGMAQVDLEEHRNRSQPLQALVPMAHTVMATVARRARAEGRLAGGEGAEEAPPERPPWRTVQRTGRTSPAGARALGPEGRPPGTVGAGRV